MRLGFFSLLRKVRRVPSGSGEPYVSLSSATALGYEFSLPVTEHIRNDGIRFIILYYRAERNLDHYVAAALAETLIRTAALAVARKIFTYKSEIDKVRYIFVGDDNYVAAVTAVPAVGAAGGLALK